MIGGRSRTSLEREVASPEAGDLEMNHHAYWFNVGFTGSIPCSLDNGCVVVSVGRVQPRN